MTKFIDTEVGSIESEGHRSPHQIQGQRASGRHLRCPMVSSGSSGPTTIGRACHARSAPRSLSTDGSRSGSITVSSNTFPIDSIVERRSGYKHHECYMGGVFCKARGGGDSIGHTKGRTSMRIVVLLGENGVPRHHRYGFGATPREQARAEPVRPHVHRREPSARHRRQYRLNEELAVRGIEIIVPQRPLPISSNAAWPNARSRGSKFQAAVRPL